MQSVWASSPSLPSSAPSEHFATLSPTIKTSMMAALLFPGAALEAPQNIIEKGLMPNAEGGSGAVDKSNCVYPKAEFLGLATQ